MAMIDKKGKLFGKISIIDLSILLVVVLAAAVVYGKFFSKPEGATPVGKAIEYDVEITMQTKEYIDIIQVGDEIRDSVRGHYLGKIIKKEVMPSVKITEDELEGKYKTAEVPGRYDVVLTLQANGIVTPQAILAEGIEVKVGQKMYIKGKGYAGTGFILGLRYE